MHGLIKKAFTKRFSTWDLLGIIEGGKEKAFDVNESEIYCSRNGTETQRSC